MTGKSMELSSLFSVCEALPAGGVPEALQPEVINALIEAWPKLGPQAYSTKMKPHKLHRAESLQWEPPILSFIMERHGSAALGSTRAELQNWDVDLTSGCITNSDAGRRQIRAMATRFDAARCAAELIQNLDNNPLGVTWISPDVIRVEPSKIVPSDRAAKRTIAGRRKRFRAKLVIAMENAGWTMLSEVVSRYIVFRRIAIDPAT